MKQSFMQSIRQMTWKKVISLAVMGGVVASGAAWALTNSYVAREVESASRTGNVAVTSDTSASGGSAVKFGQSATSCGGAHAIPAGPDPGWGCWPSPDTVGIPAGTTLTPYAGPMVLQAAQNNYVIDGKIIDGELRIVGAQNVMIRNSRIDGMIRNDLDNGGGSFTVMDSEVNVGAEPLTGIQEGNFTVLRSVVRGGARGVFCNRNATIEDSYIVGGFVDNSGVHHMSGARYEQNCILRHNVIGCDAPDIPPDAGCSAGLTGYGDFQTIQYDIIERNLFLAGGGYCTYGGSSGQGGGKPFPNAHHVQFIDNWWARGSSNKCGFYGPITSFDSDAPGNVWQNNRYYPDGANVPPAN